MESLSLRCDGRRLWLLDQSLLPREECWLEATDPSVMVEAIRALRVRGAPAIGVAAALCLGLTEGGPGFLPVAEALRAARPTAVNLMWAVDRMIAAWKEGNPLWEEAEAIFTEDVALCEAMAGYGASLIEEGEGILTHCNTGGLATAWVGTALGAIRRAWEGGRRLHVWVDETRPLLQGARLTTWELQRLGIPHTLITDSMAPILMREGRVQRVVVGADRIAANGDFANKVRTYGLTVAAVFHGVPVHVVAPRSTVDLSCADGGAIPVEERAPEELRGMALAGHSLHWAPAEVPVWNPAFDVTPGRYLHSLVLDVGILDRRSLAEGVLPRVLAP
ncbi:MAG TPA: S-methyl-5-thioribose-1-phosphate isomerase, partial [Myxococcota bacterium]|nr:S-methyl-5-thioribose-1-phosphate isomerase [Myxococcota bacterium]